MIQYLASQALLLFSGGDYHVTPTPDVVFTGHRMLEEEPKADIPLEKNESVVEQSADVNKEEPEKAGESAAELMKQLVKWAEKEVENKTDEEKENEAEEEPISKKTKKVRMGYYAWNVFRYSGDYLHLFGMLVLIFVVLVRRDLTGFSKKTQILYLIVFCSRYLDLFTHWNEMGNYLRVFKLTFIILSTISVALFYFFRSTYEKPKDTCSLFLILIVALILMILLTKKTKSDELKVVLVEYMWTLSEILEAVCLVPQYVFRYRDNANTDKGVFLFIFCLGGYRVLYMFNWIYRKIENPQYSDIRSWLAGIVEILFFIDFLMYRLKGFSILRSFVLGVDDRIGWVSDSVEFRILGKTDDDEHAAGDSELRQRKKPTNNELEEFDPTEV